MDTTLIIIALVVSAITLILVVFLLLRSKKGEALDDKAINETLKASIAKEMLDLNERLNRQMRENSDLEKEAINKLQLEVNKELDAFKEKLGDRLNNEFKDLSESIDNRMNKINEKVEERLKEGFNTTNETFNSIKQSMAVMEKAQENIKGLSEEMVSLQDLLTDNQKRGAFGEYQLEQILYTTFGENNNLYQLQYEIKNPKEKEKVRADSVIFMPNGLICIDSKFPYSNYRRLFEEHINDEEEKSILKDLKNDVKHHIDAIASKYIVPGVTTDFAVMFLPSDGILALLHLKLGDVIEYANKKNVIVVSPTTIIPLIASYRIVRIDHDRSQYAKQLGEQLVQLKKDFERFADRWDKLNGAISKLSRDSEDVSISVNKITNKFAKLSNSDVASLEEGEKEDA